jgi:hypothetical protein
MKLPADVVIPVEKLMHYLLKPRPWDDKSKFLAQADFTLSNSQTLLSALYELARTAEAVIDGVNSYGEFLRAEGSLRGPNGRILDVVTIWIRWHQGGPVRFVTLKPRKETQR